MSTTAEVVARVSRLAAGQWGLFTAAQAERDDVTRSQLTRLVDAGVLERVERGVYATTSSADPNRALRAAWLALDPSRIAEERLADPVGAGVISHTSAAALHQLGDLLDDVPEVTYPHRKQTRRGIRLHRGDLTEADITLVDGLPTTTTERTVADLLRDGHDPDHIAQTIGQGVRHGVIDLADLAERLDPLARRYGQPNGQSLVGYLLDLVGLSPTALARELARSTAGQELLAAGRAMAFTEMFASILPTIDLAPMLALNKSVGADILGIGKFDVGRIVGLTNILETIRLTNPATAQIAQLAKGLLPPGEASSIKALAQSQAPAAPAATDAVHSTTAAKQGRPAPGATRAQSPTNETEEKA